MQSIHSEPRTMLYQGNCLEVLKTFEAESIDAVITDPPYPEIDRPYGRITEADWHVMMRGVVAECRRILKPSGSAVFVLQANQERVGRTRPWLWEFMAWTAREWNQVQDVWWWNTSAPPTVHCHEVNGLMRPSLKACVWLGAEDCFRDQSLILMQISESTLRDRRRNQDRLDYHPSGGSYCKGRMLQRCVDRGGSTPFNVFPIANSNAISSAAANGHGAGTPADICDLWIRCIVPSGGIVCDPFMGSGTIILSAISQGIRAVGIEKYEEYFLMAEKRIRSASLQGRLF